MVPPTRESRSESTGQQLHGSGCCCHWDLLGQTQGQTDRDVLQASLQRRKAKQENTKLVSQYSASAAAGRALQLPDKPLKAQSFGAPSFTTYLHLQNRRRMRLHRSGRCCARRRAWPALQAACDWRPGQSVLRVAAPSLPRLKLASHAKQLACLTDTVPRGMRSDIQGQSALCASSFLCVASACLMVQQL